jgi:hypothetical protein
MAGRSDGSVALLWSRVDVFRDVFRDRIMTRVVDRNNALSDAVTLERDSEALLLPLGLVATPHGFRALWNHGGPLVWTFRTADMALDGTSALARVLARDGGHVRLSPRPSGGYVKHWVTWGRALFVQLLDDEAHPAGPIIRVDLAGAQSWPRVLHQRDGSFVVLVEQEVRGFRLVTRAQRFDADGRPFGALLRLLLPGHGHVHVAALGDDGTIVVSMVYNDLRLDSVVLTLRAFTADGEPLWHRDILKPLFPGEIVPAAVVVDHAGRVLWVWADYAGQSYNINAFRARVFAPTGQPLGDTFALATKASADRPYIRCANANWAGEDWVVTWLASGIGSDDESMRTRVYLRRFARD